MTCRLRMDETDAYFAFVPLLYGITFIQDLKRDIRLVFYLSYPFHDPFEIRLEPIGD